MTVSATNHLALEAHGLGKRFARRWALAHLDLEVQRGTALLVAGSNGSGKTTLLKLIAGLYRPTTGNLWVLGREPCAERFATRERLSVVGHDAYLYERLTAIETLRYWARAAARPHHDEELVAFLEEVSLADRRDSMISTFSAGMKRRLALARSRLEKPQVLLLDEPFAALDVSGQRLVEDWVRRGRETGMTIIIASHQLAQASDLCDTAVLLHEGQMSWSGDATDLPNAFERLS